MKIQKQLVSKINDKLYYKHVVIIPQEALEEAGLKEGDELEAKAKIGEIMLMRKK